MERINTKVAFFIEQKRRRGINGDCVPREVTAVFVDSGNYHFKDCYCHVGQHGTCAIDWIEENCRPATYAEYRGLYDELTEMVGYNLEVLEAAWWLDDAMWQFKAVQNFYDGGNRNVA